MSSDPPKKGQWRVYLLMWLLINTTLWSAAILYLKKAKPTYISEWALILPGTGPGVSVNLPEIGQASSSSSSAFGGASSDPRANYQFIATSEAVLGRAATQMNLSIEEFGKPRVKLLDNTTIMTFQVTGSTPEQTQQKSRMMYQALVQRLSELRVEELGRRDEGVQATMKAAQSKLHQAQKRLSEYKVSSGLSFQGQVDNLSVNVEQLRRQRSETLAKRQQTGTRLAELAANIGITPEQAAKAFVLQADQQFQQNLKDYSESSASLVVLLSKWGENHPNVVKEQARQQAAQIAIAQRSTELLKQEVDPQLLEFLQLGANDQGAGRSSLFRDLITTQVEYEGFNAEVQSLEQQINQLDDRLSGLAQRQSTLENLKRDVQTAEAVFASTLARIDLSKSDIFTAYPLTQLIAEPSLPTSPSTPKKSLVYLGAGLGSVLSGAALTLLAMRKRLLMLYQNRKKQLPASSPEQTAL
ncbi:hypothetical protein IQ250_06690 [Pseudanabaenaceae cyanobacterium LEGE 13415]|nr:hypothetical protein [Pseudanabaenaceae cyanobacterium LEGE 13415]